MTWMEQYQARRVASDRTNKPIAFAAFLPNLQISDGRCIALIKPNNRWSGPSNLLLEIEKSYPETGHTTFTTHVNGTASTYDAIEFRGNSAEKFVADFLSWGKEHKAPSPSR